MDRNPQFWGNGDKNDVALSYEDWLDMVSCLHDEKLSQEMKLRFKNLRQINQYGMAFVPIYCFPIAYGLTYAILGPVRRSHAGYRNFWTIMSLTLPISCWYGYTLPIPRRLYSDIIAAQDADGTYIRQTISKTKPGLWRTISRQLYNKNWNFPEMIEYNQGTEFPLDFVNPHKF